MESETLDLDMAVKGLAVLSAIPVVALALWAEYTDQSITRLIQNRAELDRAAELQKVRFAGFLAFLFQALLFLGTSEVRDASPLLPYLITGTALLLQSRIQHRLELKLEARPKSQGESRGEGPAGVFLRILAVCFLGGTLYVAILFASIQASILLARALQTSQEIGTVVLLIGGTLGVSGGLAINFALGAFHLRKMFRTKPLVDPVTLALARSCFANAKIRPPSFWVIESEQFRFANALVAGFRRGSGPFRQGVFLSRTLLQNLTSAELRAVLLHEVSHISLSHLAKRLSYSIGLIVGSALLATIFVLIVRLVSGDDKAAFIAGYLGGFGAFLATMSMLSKQSRHQELEADLHSIEKLGSNVEDLASALRKLDHLNEETADSRAKLGNGHPSTEKRIRVIRAYFAVRDKAGSAETQSSNRKAA